MKIQHYNLNNSQNKNQSFNKNVLVSITDSRPEDFLVKDNGLDVLLDIVKFYKRKTLQGRTLKKENLDQIYFYSDFANKIYIFFSDKSTEFGANISKEITQLKNILKTKKTKMDEEDIMLTVAMNKKLSRKIDLFANSIDESQLKVYETTAEDVIEEATNYRYLNSPISNTW